MKMLVAGASGFVGGRLLAEAALEGVETAVLQRPASVFCAEQVDQERFNWDPGAGTMAPGCLQNVDTVVNLCGAGIADARWTNKRRKELVSSRIQSTRTLVQALAREGGDGRVLLNASAVGYYGHRAEACLSENCTQGDGFLAGLCGEWEAEALKARQYGVRVVLLRFGMVLGEGGGVLARMSKPFRFGLGGPFGDGRAWMSWISLEDLARVILFCAGKPEIEGPVNVVAPQALRNRDFVTALAAAYGRNARLRLPAWLLRLVFGEMAREALLGSTRVLPERLLCEGFCYRDPELAELLESIIHD